MASGSASVLSGTGNSIAYYAIVEADISSESNTTATITVTAKAQSVSTTSSYTYATVYCGSSSTAITTSGKQTPGSTTTFGSASYSYTKTTSSQSVTCKAKVWVPGSSESGLSAGATASCTVTVPALASYTIKYDANGGSGAPSSQTKYYGITLTLSSTKPTRTGYTFQGWGTSSSTSTVTYAAGASYTANAAATLYAVWKADTYTISYDANGGSGAPSSQTKTYGVTLTLSTTKPTRTNYNFLGWSTSKSATSATYAAGGSFTTNADTTLYAVWELAYSSPSISAASVYRVGSSGSSTASAVGGYAYATFTWSIDQTSGTYTAKTLTIKYRVSTSTSYTSCTISGTGTGNKSGTTTASFTASTGSSYIVEFSVTDSSGNSNATTTVTRTLASAAYPIHVSKDGTGVGLLSAAPSSGVEIGGNTIIDGTVRATRLDMNDGTNTRSGVIQIFDDGDSYDYGSEVTITGAGNTFIGAGEAPNNLRTQLQSATSSGESYGQSSERLYVCSDNEVYLYSYCNTIGNRHGIVLDTSGRLRPLTSGGADLGTSSYVWDDIYGTSFVSKKGNVAFYEQHPTTGTAIGFGCGSGGTNRGVYDSLNGRWLLYTTDDGIARICNGLYIYNAGSTTYTPIYGIYRGTTVISSSSWSSGRATLFSTSNQSSYFGRYLTGANYDVVLVCNGDWNNANSSQTYVAELTDGSSYSSGSVYVRCSDTSLASARRINWVVIKGSA